MALTAETPGNLSPAPHFVLVPLLLQGHTIPMVDLACLLAARGARVSIVTTTVNAAQLQGVAERARRAKLLLEIVELPFPAAASPPPCSDSENVDDFLPLLQGLRVLASPLEAYLRALARRPSCMINDSLSSWAVGVARSVGVPRLSFQPTSCFFALCARNVGRQSGEDSGYVVPGMPLRVEMTKDTWSSSFLTTPAWEELLEEASEGVHAADGVVANTFMDLEEQLVQCYEAALGKPVWAVGPSCCLSNRPEKEIFLTTTTHANAMDDDQQQSAVMAWLDTMEQSVVIYVSFGSLVWMPPDQLYEVGHGLEESGRPFLWVVKESEETAVPEARRWLQALEARTAGRGLVARGWAPQLAILSHRAVGGFLTHCGWNSLLEAVTLGVPVLTWPHFADQFINQRLAVDVLGIGVPVVVVVVGGAAAPAVVVRGEVIARAVSELMGDGAVAQERRAKCKEYGERAHRAMEKGGSSYDNLTKLLHNFTPRTGRGRSLGI
uniref:Uncharacterized protein n=1 Tax=Avena sativa TaxID=4498 RepID=A0ACD5V2C2_AVESA